MVCSKVLLIYVDRNSIIVKSRTVLVITLEVHLFGLGNLFAR